MSSETNLVITENSKDFTNIYHSHVDYNFS